METGIGSIARSDFHVARLNASERRHIDWHALCVAQAALFSGLTWPSLALGGCDSKSRPLMAIAINKAAWSAARFNPDAGDDPLGRRCYERSSHSPIRFAPDWGSGVRLLDHRITIVSEIIPQVYFSRLRRFAQGRGSGTRWPKETAVAVIQPALAAPGNSSGQKPGEGYRLHSLPSVGFAAPRSALVRFPQGAPPSL
jgi:hypothetical protein